MAKKNKVRILRIFKLPLALLAISLIAMGTHTLAQEFSLPVRAGTPPETTINVPHMQIGVKPVPELTEKMLAHVAKFSGVKLGPTRLSLPGAIGFQLKDNLPLAKPDSIVGGREFAHVHADGSLHASLDPKIAREAVRTGWAIPHPWADQRFGWEGFVLIYTPLTDIELEVVLRLLESSYFFITGRSPTQ